MATTQLEREFYTRDDVLLKELETYYSYVLDNANLNYSNPITANMCYFNNTGKVIVDGPKVGRTFVFITKPNMNFSSYENIQKARMFNYLTSSKMGTTLARMLMYPKIAGDINYGGYPEVVFNNKIKENPGQFIRHDIIDKVLLRDLPSLYGIQDVQELNSLFTMIAYHSGAQFSYETMSKESGVRKDLLKKYIQYLEAAFLIKVIHRTDDNAKRYQREVSFKIYLTNPSLRCALFQPINVTDEEIGELVETAVYVQWIPRIETDISFANWKLNKKEQGEVDIVGIDKGRLKPKWVVEIKWSDRFAEHAGELSSLLWYMEKNALSEAIVTTETITKEKQMEKVKLHFIPVACYVYTVGKNTLNQEKYTIGL